MKTSNIPIDLILAQKHAWEPSGYICSEITQNSESQEYSAYSFLLGDKSIVFRIAKITPTKIGQFVTLWIRSEKWPIIPYHKDDKIDTFIVLVRQGEKFGQFIFPKKVLIEKWIISQNGRLGKLAIRVYSSWDITENPQAKRTQKWQSEYFIEIGTNGVISEENREKVKLLLWM